MSLDSLRGATVAVLLGGNSAERDISLQSGQAVVDALQALGFAVRPVDPAQPDWMTQLQGAAFVFIALRMSGDAALQIYGPDASAEAIEALREAWGLNKPIW